MFFEGLEVGSPEYCENVKCYVNGSKLCFLEHEETVKYKNQDGSIPIKAWVYVKIGYYSVLIEEMDYSFEYLAICSIYGINFNFSKLPTLIKVCSAPYCFELTPFKIYASIDYPREILIKEHISTIEIWISGILVNKTSISCLSISYCDLIQCYICLENVKNPQCYNTTYFFSFWAYALYIHCNSLYYIKDIDIFTQKVFLFTRICILFM